MLSNRKTQDEVRPLVVFVSPPTMALDVISKGLGHKHSVTFGVINGVTSAIQRTKVTLTVTLNGTGRDTHTNGDTQSECP